jgi:hypothetical protein
MIIGRAASIRTVGERKAAYADHASKSGLTAQSNKAAENGTVDRVGTKSL